MGSTNLWWADAGLGAGMIVEAGLWFSSSVVIWSVKASAILMAAAAVSVVLRRGPASLRHRVWLVAIGSVLLLPVFEAGLPPWPVLPNGLGEGFLRADRALEASATRPDVLEASLGAPQMPARMAESAPPAEAAAPPSVRVDYAPVAIEESTIPATVAATLPGSELATPVIPGETSRVPSAALLGIWLLGLLGWSSLVGAGLLRARFMYRSGARPPTRVRDLGHDIAAGLGLRRPVSIRTSQRLAVPITWGALRPRILIPESALSWSDARLRRVLLHEMAHIKRRDWATGLVAEMTRSLHWYNPLVWLAIRSLRMEQERACDDQVLGSGVRPTDYAHDLLELARGLRRRLTADPVVPLARSSKLADRVGAVLDPTKRRRTQGTGTALLSAGGVLMAFLPLAMLSPAGPLGEHPSETAGSGAPPAPVLDRADVAPVPVVEPALQPQEVVTCVFREGERHSSNTQSNDGEWDIKWSTANCEAEVEIRGEVVFNEAENGIASMARGASVEIEERVAGVRRRLVIESDGDSVSYRFWLNRDEQTFDADARAWLAAFLPQLFRHTTIQAEERVARIFARSGTRGVIDEVGQINSDHVAARYLGLLMEQPGFEAAEVPEVLGLVARRMDSDHYVAMILGSVAEQFGIRPEFEASYLSAVEGIESDHYVHQTLMALLDREDVSGPALRRVLEQASRTQSDHYQAMLLVRAAQLGALEEAERDLYIAALGRMDSPHYHHQVVNALLDNGPLEADEVPRLLELTETIGSDHYRAAVLQRVATETELDGAGISAFLRSASGIESDHYAAEIGLVVVSKEDLTPAQIDLVLGIAAGISSDHNRTRLMVSLVEAHELSSAARARYRDLAADIGSRHNQDQALAALVRMER